MPTESRTIAVPGGQLHAIAEGDGPPILLVHAGIVDLRAWDPLVPHLVAAGHRVIRYDTRGYGQSTTDDVDFSNRADLVAVLDAFGVERAVLVGNSRGAMISLDTLLEFPDRVAGFAWVGGGIGGFDAGAVTPEEAAVFERADALESSGSDPDALADLEARIWADGPRAAEGRAPRWIRDAVRDMDRPLLEPGRVMGRPIVLDPPANERLGEIRVPVLAVVGAEDTSEVLAAAERLEAAVAGSRRVVLPDVAHMVGMEAPERLAELIGELVRPIGGWA